MSSPLFDAEGPSFSLLYSGGAALPDHTPAEIRSHWLDEWRERIRTRRDNIIAIDGPTGEGKSALGYRLARAYDRGFDRRRVVYSASEMLEMWGSVRPGSAVLYDESVKGLLSRNFRTEENTLLLQAGMTARKLLVTVFLCIPDFMFLDVGFRAALVKYRIVVRGRGTADVHVRSDKARYRTSDHRGHYIDREWSPLRWTNPDGEAEWDAVYARSIELARQFAKDSAAQLEARRKLEDPAARLRDVQDRRARREHGRDEILHLHDEGKTNAEIAASTGKNERTVQRALALARATGALGSA